MLPDGRVGFLDFGIVGRISPVTWRAVELLLQSLAVRGGWQLGLPWAIIAGAAESRAAPAVLGGAWGLAA